LPTATRRPGERFLRPINPSVRESDIVDTSLQTLAHAAAGRMYRTAVASRCVCKRRHFLRSEIMANLSLFNPFRRHVEAFNDPFDELMRRMWQPIQWAPETSMDIRIDVEEDDQAYTVKAEIPGVKKEDIKVEVDGNTVSISAESKREEEVKEKGRVVRNERYYGSLYRSFSLAHDVDEEKASAKYTDGVLELTLPKRADAKTKQISVQ